METESVLKRIKSFKYIIVLEGVAVGFLAGIAVSFFRLFIEKAAALRNVFINQDISLLTLLPFIFAGIIIYLCIRFEKNACGSGIPQVKAELAGQLAAAKEELQPMKDIRYWVSKVLTPEQSEVEKKPEPKHSVTEKMKFLQEQSNHQPEQKTPQQKKQNMEL